MKRLLAFCALAVVAGTASIAAASSASLHLTPIGRLRFPDRGYVVDLPRHANLTAGQVTVRENGSPVEDLRLMPAGEATATRFGVVLAIDASDSMRGRPYRGALAAARTFAARRSARELVGVVAFNSRTHVLLRPTSDKKKLHDALARSSRLATGTHIYDAVSKAVGLLEQADVSSGVVVLLSDGSDTGSRLGEAKVSALAKAKHVRVFTVGLRSHDFSRAPLEKLALDTGASFAEARSSGDLRGIYSGLSAKLASEYLLAYRSQATPRSRVDVTVSIEGFGDAELTYRAGAPRGLGPYHRSLLERFWASPLSLLAVALAAMGAVGGALALLLRRRPSTVIARLGDYVSLASDEDERRRPLLSERLVASTETSLSRTEWWARFQEELEIAGITIVPAQIAVATAAGALVVAVIGALVWLPLFILGAAVPLVVRAAVKHKLQGVRNDFLEQLPDNLQVLASALRAGHSFTGALAVVAKDAPEPARREFQRVVADDQLGVPVEESLREVARRMESEDFEQVAVLAELQREAGGNMAEVLDTVVETIRERFDLRRLVKTLTAQGRMARWILTALPVFLAIVISLLNPGYMKPLFESSGGRMALMLAAAMVVTGSLLIKRIVNIKV